MTPTVSSIATRDERSPRWARRFRLCLALGAIPLIAIPLECVLLVTKSWLLKREVLRFQSRHPRRARRAEWSMRFLALTAIDLVIGGVTIAAVVRTTPATRLHIAISAPARGWLGIHDDRKMVETSGGAHIGLVMPDSPASRAGLERGDIVIAIDGKPVADSAALGQAIGELSPGIPRILRVRRGGRVQEIGVIPVAPRHSSAPQGLFEPRGNVCPKFLLDVPWNERTEALVNVGGLALVFWIVAAVTESSTAPIWGWTFAGLAVADLAALGVPAALCRKLGGPTEGSFLITSLAAKTVMLVLAYLGASRLERRGLIASGEALTLGTVAAIRRGMLYLLGAQSRTAVLVGAVILLTTDDTVRASAPILKHPAVASGVGGMAMDVFSSAFLAPIAEEFLFRGILLGGLARCMNPVGALLVSSVVFAMGHAETYHLLILVHLVQGLVLGWAWLRTRALRAPIALHMTVNAVALSPELLHRGLLTLWT